MIEQRTFMRMIVFFDLPTITKKNKQDYVRFRRFLLQDGFDMIQFSVYSRIVVGKDGELQHYNRIKAHLPPKGSIRCMTVTEKQFARMIYLNGEKNTSVANSDRRLVFLGEDYSDED